jgi:hypothetical protein
MGWNGSNSTNVYSKQNKRAVHTAPKRTILKIVICTGVCLIGAFFILYFFDRFEKVEKAESTLQPQKVKTIESTPQKSEKAKSASIKKDIVIPKTKPTKIGEVVNGYMMLADKTLHKIKPGATNTTISIKGRYAIFQHRCDNELAGILCAKPGSIVVGDPAYNKWFTKAFIESLKTPIIIKDDDSLYATKDGMRYGTSDHIIIRQYGSPSLILGDANIMDIVHTTNDNLDNVDYSDLEKLSDVLSKFIVQNSGNTFY